MPFALICFSNIGSNSSITYNLSTLLANSLIICIGSGFTIPSFKILASGIASSAYFATTPLQIIPIFVDLYVILLISILLLSTDSLFILASTTLCLPTAIDGIIAYFVISLT